MALLMGKASFSFVTQQKYFRPVMPVRQKLNKSKGDIMSNNWSFLGDVADWYDYQTNRLIVYRNSVFRYADPRDLSGWNSMTSPIGLWAAWGSGLIHMSQGVVDTLRIGNGIRAGGWGYAQDALRALNLFDGAGRVIGRIGRVMHAVFQPAGTVTCAWYSIINGLERTGNNFFISIRDLMTSVGISESAIISARGTTPAMFRRLIGHLRQYRMEIEELRAGLHVTGWEALKAHAAIRRRGVFVVGFHYARQAANVARNITSEGHAIMATFSREYGLIFQDTNGRIYAGLAALRQVYPEANLARDYPIVFIRDSAMVTSAPLASGAAQTARAAAEASGQGSILENIVVPVVSVISQAVGRE
jgi:hypothetical protein